MAQNTAPIFGLTPISTPVTIVPADTTGKKTLYTAGANGGRLLSCAVASDDTAAVRVNIYVTVSAIDYNIGQVTVPIGAGTGTTDAPSVNLLDGTKLPFLDADGSILLPAGAIVKVAANATITAAKTVWFTPVALDY
ncbi:MAG TPA: hypothetical protein VJZ72_00070 [Candidatus Limnocylindrales bacterium]|nr:hypothetical protein [Candidatus Limnocylindrales bacterium]